MFRPPVAGCVLQTSECIYAALASILAHIILHFFLSELCKKFTLEILI